MGTSLRRLLTGALTIGLCGLSHPPAVRADTGLQEGASIVPVSSTDFASSNFQASIAELAADHATSVDLVIPYYQSNVGSTDVQAGWNTPTDASLEQGIQTAEAAGLQVMLTIHDDPYDGQWRAYINPGDRASWFANYGAVLDHYATIAQQQGVSSYCLGAELYDMTSYQVNGSNTAYWEAMIQSVRQRFSGTLTYSANWGAPADEKDQIGFWPDLDEIGLSAYFQLNTDDSVADLETAWADWNASDIAPLQARYGKPVVFTEVGYQSATNSHLAPGMYNWVGADQTEQANDYQALLGYWLTQPNFNGLYLWQWSSDPNAGGANDTGYTPQHKAAEAVMAEYFSGSGASSLAPAAAVQVWWPMAGTPISGLQTFQATLPGRDPSTYSMYWQVDGGQLNSMPDGQASVDTSGWNWQVSGQYQITFVAKDTSGMTIGSSSESIMIQQ